MYNLSSKFNTFYANKVVLSRDEYNELREKKDLNIERLRKGLVDYNAENNTSYKVSDIVEQGSVAMSTVTQNDKSDYDIDVAVIFDSTNIDGKGSIAIKNIVVNALKKKCTQLKKEPEALINCVRVEYASGYHVDFAIYKRTLQSDGSYIYEHAGSTWQERDPKAINKWFADCITEHGDTIRKLVRLSKMFCKSRSHWMMPGGLLQSVLCEENFQDSDRLDEAFYYTMHEIKNRLSISIETYNPVDSSKSLLLKDKDKTKMTNWKNRLESELEKLDVLFENDCTESKAMQAWQGFFSHDFWATSIESNPAQNFVAHSARGANEQFINEMFPVKIQYSLSIDCDVSADGFRPQSLFNIIKLYRYLSRNKKLRFYISNTDAPLHQCDIYWKVRNVGAEAERRNCVRGEIKKTNLREQKESSDFNGPHFVECYLVQNGFCVAKAKIDVPIE